MSDHYNQYRQLGIAIKYYRNLRNMSQADLAEKINKSRTYISKIEAPNVRIGLRLDTLFDIADALEVTPDQLLQYPHDHQKEITDSDSSQLQL